MDDTRLMEGLQKGGLAGRQYEDQLYLSYNYFIREGCTKYSLAKDDSFSAYSDAVIAVINNIRSQKFEGRSSLKTYLFQVFCNKCIDIVRKNSTDKASVNQTRSIDDLAFLLPDDVQGVIDKMMQKINRNILMQNLKAIGEKCYAILTLFEEGLTDREIAEQLSYQTAAVAKTSRLRCLGKLRERVTQNNE